MNAALREASAVAKVSAFLGIAEAIAEKKAPAAE
jgi:hypothetical protein